MKKIWVVSWHMDEQPLGYELFELKSMADEYADMIVRAAATLNIGGDIDIEVIEKDFHPG